MPTAALASAIIFAVGTTFVTFTRPTATAFYIPTVPSMAVTPLHVARSSTAGCSTPLRCGRICDSRPSWKTRTHLRSYEAGGDSPSDVDDHSSDAELLTKPRVVDDNLELRESMKREIIAIAATSNRGQIATQEEKTSAMDLIYELEASNPTIDTTSIDAVGGVWELIYTDTQPFRSSPFFMAVDELFGDERGLAEALFAFHRAATSNGEIGRVKQTISESLIVSEMDLRVGLSPALPFSATGTVVTKAKLSPSSLDTFDVSVESTTVTNNNVAPFLDDAITVPLQQVYESFRGSVPDVRMSTFYLDDTMRISRASDKHVFVYIRAVA